ncbi:bacteriocin-protection, YdeI or OmpD-associated-domain-containing protein [Apiosordaria backusii]|uniref:Bacteriocin-protection, YdeI or OmpD-associated-domain-containing protein n=1 Tax=Apiosordaria backusii TaxID=314023 RepID=A0AA40BMX5_9PEZI|nr:bacteriocin-protection, YdeI or OmpD-associated-domain-containing protein [Apiosordaria backusii]
MGASFSSRISKMRSTRSRTAAAKALQSVSEASSAAMMPLKATPARAKTNATKAEPKIPTKAAPKPAQTPPLTPTPATLPFPTAASFTTWLATNHFITPLGIWLKISKKNSNIPSISYDEAIDCALCYGWIDGQRKGLDTVYFLQRFTPRRKNSMWSKRNVDKVAVLTKEGRMTEAGLAEVERAQKDGRWERAYDGASMMEMPEDFGTALAENEKAKGFWEGLGKTKRYAFLFRLATAKRPETRKRKIGEFVALLGEWKTL